MHGIVLPWWLSDKESAYQCRRQGFNPWVRKIPWRRAWQPTPVFPGESHGQRSLVGSWGCKELEMTEQLNKNEIMHGIFEWVCMCVYIWVPVYMYIYTYTHRKNPRRKKTGLENTWFQSTLTQSYKNSFHHLRYWRLLQVGFTEERMSSREFWRGP